MVDESIIRRLLYSVLFINILVVCPVQCLDCSDGTYGINCENQCSEHCQNACDKVTGTCSPCESGWQGSFCDTASTQEADTVAIIAYGVAATVAVVALIAAVYILLRIRKQRQQQTCDTRDEIYAFSNPAKKRSITSINPYDNYAESTEHTSKESRDSSDVNSGQGSFPHKKTEHEIVIADLESYVKRGLADKNYFVKQFQEILHGVYHIDKHGHADKTKYNAMYTYNHSGADLETIADQPVSDYIDATYIKGNFKENAYIALQGPVEANMNEFWTMIWEKDIYTIVMTTNPMESNMWCMQYWPDETDTSMQCGLINVYMDSEDVFAEFTIRQLRVYHVDQENLQRNVTQFHYTAWPDNDVPTNTSSLLQFWHKVRKNDARKTHTWLVHCSAGVGRTGTFVALDILYDQCRDLGSVDVYQCVSDLREQRVNMIQTKDQYKFLHSIVVEALVLPSEPVLFYEYHKVYTDLLDCDRTTGKTKLLLQYETFLEQTDNGNEADENDHMYHVPNHAEDKIKNKYDNMLATNEFRPHLPGCSDVINAVYLPSYLDAHAYILTQTPLKHTAIDYCRLVHEQDVKIIVTFDNGDNEEVWSYPPAIGCTEVGPFTITFVAEREWQCYKIRTHLFRYSSKEHTITQYIYKHWPSGNASPRDACKMLAFLLEIDAMQRQCGNKPIIAQCLNGAERSGLYVVLMNILERAMFEEEVSIPQVIRELRIRSKRIIPNFEQYMFCHEVFLSWVEGISTHSNRRYVKRT